MEVEGATRAGRAARGGEEEDKAVARSYHITVLLGKLVQSVRLVTYREGGECFLPDDPRTNTGRQVAEVL